MEGNSSAPILLPSLGCGQTERHKAQRATGSFLGQQLQKGDGEERHLTSVVRKVLGTWFTGEKPGMVCQECPIPRRGGAGGGWRARAQGQISLEKSS